MFSAIAGRYDLLNRLLSGSIDQYWRRVFVREIERRLRSDNPRILDVGCGTGDLSVAFAHTGPVVGCDFAHPMLCLGVQKVMAGRGRFGVGLVEADALGLPFRDSTFDVVVSAFVVRNLANIKSGLREMRRVLRPNGILGILDFSMPRMPVLGSMYRFYFLRILPVVGEWISGVAGAYRYLPESVQIFPPPERLRVLVAEEGFRDVEIVRMTGGIAVLLLAQASPAEG